MSECKLCSNECHDLNHEIELMVIEMIKKQNPQWIDSDGACSKCINYYSSLDDAIEVCDD